MKTLKLHKKFIASCMILSLGTGCAKVEFNPVETENSSGVEVPAQPTPSKTVSTIEVVAYGNKQVDFLLVLDDSSSMMPELKKLAARLSTFVSSLEASSIDWQMCLTTTRGYVSGGIITHGPNLIWKNYSPAASAPSYLLRKGTSNLNSIFTSTIEGLAIGGSYSGDERGIKAAHDHFKNAPFHECYRPGAAISVIMISDEDERSVGGDEKNVKSTDAAGSYIPLETEDLPETLVARARASFGNDVRFTFNSIIVKPGDLACETEQDKDTSPSHFGNLYEAASKLTDGGVGSICDADYGPSLNTFKDKVVNSLSSLTLQCEADPTSLKIKVEGLAIHSVKLDGKVLKFAYPLIEGTKIDLSYTCID